MPLVPLRVGLVASRGSAAWHDVLHELQGSGIGFRISHVDVRVQGQDAAAAVAGAVRTLSRRPLDVIVIVRGGGSRTDLAAFDDEGIALAIAGAPVPVLTGLGHEVDRSVADQVAHTAYKTPTACAAALVDRVRQFDATVATVARGIASRTTLAVRLAGQRLDHAAGRLQRETDAGLDGAARHLAAASGRLASRSPGVLRHSEQRLDVAWARLQVLDPAAALARGWSITRRADGTPGAGGRRAERRRRARHHPGRRHRHQPRGRGRRVSAPGDDLDGLDGLGYAEALAELEAILAGLEREAVDVDHLAERVQRAAALIRLCRGRVALGPPRDRDGRGRPRAGGRRGLKPAER